MSQTCSTPESLFIVRSTLEMVALMKALYPDFEAALNEIEAEVRCGGQMLVAAGSTTRAHTALDSIRLARLRLEQFKTGAPHFTA